MLQSILQHRIFFFSFKATIMFVGEMTCGVAYLITLFVQRYKWKKKHPGVDPKALSPSSFGDGEKDNATTTSQITDYPAPPKMNLFLFAAPAFCDVCATSVQYLGLNLTSASSYQMLRGDFCSKFLDTSKAELNRNL